MLDVIEALDGHVAREGVEVEVRVRSGSWIDMRDIVKPWSKLLDQIVDLCNETALDPDEAEGSTQFEQGRSSMAHEILRQIAQTSEEVSGG